MGSKGGDSPPETTKVSGTDMSGMYEMMALMMASNSSTDAPTVEDAPAVVAADSVNWAEKTNSLSNQAKANYAQETADRKGRMSTIHAGSDDSDPVTTESLLAG